MTYEVPNHHCAFVCIYNVKGMVIRRVVTQEISVGRGTAYWDGKDSIGKRSACGLYLVVLRCGEKQIVRKVLLY
jgi:hypothetical protein